MITAFVFQVLFWVAGTLPTGYMPSGFYNALTSVFESAMTFNAILPVSESITILKLIVLFEFIRFIFTLGRFAIGILITRRTLV